MYTSHVNLGRIVLYIFDKIRVHKISLRLHKIFLWLRFFFFTSTKSFYSYAQLSASNLKGKGKKQLGILNNSTERLPICPGYFQNTLKHSNLNVWISHDSTGGSWITHFIKETTSHLKSILVIRLDVSPKINNLQTHMLLCKHIVNL